MNTLLNTPRKWSVDPLKRAQELSDCLSAFAPRPKRSWTALEIACAQQMTVPDRVLFYLDRPHPELKDFLP